MTILEEITASIGQAEICRLVLTADAVSQAKAAADHADFDKAQAFVVKALYQIGSANISRSEKRRVITKLFECSKAPSDIAMAGKLAEVEKILSILAPLSLMQLATEHPPQNES